jgi:hypothetical protein
MLMTTSASRTVRGIEYSWRPRPWCGTGVCLCERWKQNCGARAATSSKN